MNKLELNKTEIENNYPKCSQCQEDMIYLYYTDASNPTTNGIYYCEKHYLSRPKGYEGTEKAYEDRGKCQDGFEHRDKCGNKKK